MKTIVNSETSERPMKTRHQTVWYFKSNQFGTVYQITRISQWNIVKVMVMVGWMPL